MGTSPENTLTSFDLDLLICSASSSLTETIDHGYQTQNVGTDETTNSYQVQNLGTSESTDYSRQVQNHGISGTSNNYQFQNMNTNQLYQNQMGSYNHVYQTQNLENELSYSIQGEEMIQKSDYDALVSNFQKLSTDFVSLQNDYKSKDKDYNAVKRQYAKLASDFANLHRENNEHAMASLNTTAKCENMEKKEVEYLATIKALTNKCDKYSIDIVAQSKQFVQYQSYVEDLNSQILTLKNSVKTEKNNGKDSRKMISTLTSNSKTLKEHLCLFACVIEGRKQLDKESRRFIKKYCKKSNSSKNSTDTESFENQSIDTGRGSSLAYSDGESFYSPSYTCSPFSAGNMTPRNEPTKIKYSETSDVSPSPINFEKGFICSPVIQTIDVATNTIIGYEDKSSMARVETRSIATSPVAFDEISPVTKVRTMNIGTSPVSFDEPSLTARTINTSTSSIRFDNTCVDHNAEPMNSATSPIIFNDTNLAAKAVTLNTATSPVRFDDANIVVKAITMNTGTSPVRFDETNLVAKAMTVNARTSPVRFHDSNLAVKAVTLNTATSPVQFDDTNLVTKANTMNTGTSPVRFDNTNLVAKTITTNTGTSPIRFDDSNLAAKTITLNTATSPVQFADTNLAAKAITMNTGNSPVNFDNTNLVAKAITTNTGTSPVRFDDTNLTAKTRLLNTATSPKRFEDTHSMDNSRIPAFAISPVQYLDTKTSTDKTRRASPIKGPLVETKFLHNEKTEHRKQKPIASRNIAQIPVSKKPVTKSSTSCHVSRITEKLKEIVSKQTHSHHDTENDLEIKMILSKHRMNWNMLSPMSQSPEAEQNEPNQSEKKEQRNIEVEIQSLAKSLYLSEDDSSDNEIEREESRISELPIANPPQEANSNVLFDLMKNQVESDKTESVKSHNTGDNTKYESQKEISNNNRAYPTKTRVSSTKGKKLTNLQKIYKANIRKSLINIEDLPPVNRTDLDPKPHSMSPIKHSVLHLSSHNKEKESKWSKKSTENLQNKEQAAIGVCKESTKCSAKEPLQLPKDKAKEKSSDPLLLLAKVLPKSDISRQSNSTSDLPSHTNPPSESDTKAVSNNTSTLSQTNPLIESVSNKCIKTSVIQWNSACSLPEQVKPSSESVQEIVSISDLPHSKAVQKSQPIKKLSIVKDIQTNDTIVFPHTRTHPLPVACTKKRSVTETPINQTNDTTHTDINLPVTEGKKTDSQQELSNNPPECRTSIPELIDDVGYSYPKPIHKRISRVKTDITSNTSIPRSQMEISTTNDRISTSDKLKRGADVVSDELHVKRKRETLSQQNPTNSDANMDQNMITRKSKEQQSEILNITHMDEPRSPDDSNMLCLMKSPSYQSRAYADYNDIALFTKTHSPKKYKSSENWTNNILDRMVYKYGSSPTPVKKPNCKNDEAVALQIKTGIDRCVKCQSDPEEYAKTSLQLVTELQKLGKQKIITGMIKYLNDPARKPEFIIGYVKFQKVLTSSTATPTEMALIDVIQSLDKSGIVSWDLFLDSLECTLFNLEKGATPGFDVIESVSHLYSNICRFQSNVSRMWMFMLNAMYCLTFKAIPIIKNCLDVMPEVLPYSSTYLAPGLAPLIRCLVFLLNYYSCEDPFKRVDAIRRLLKYKYYYNLQDENETTLLFLLKQSILNLTEYKLERDMLELSFLIVAKRKGTKWCHKNLVQKIILPIIKDETGVSYRAKQFCITTIGHLMKPYNNDMTVHTEEVVNMLMHMFNQESQPHEIKEDIIRGLLNLNMNTLSGRINACLFTWNPPSVSPELEEALQMYVSRKNLKSWHQAYKNYYREI